MPVESSPERRMQFVVNGRLTVGYDEAMKASGVLRIEPECTACLPNRTEAASSASKWCSPSAERRGQPGSALNVAPPFGRIRHQAHCRSEPGPDRRSMSSLASRKGPDRLPSDLQRELPRVA